MPPTVFGSSEIAERRVARRLRRHGWRVPGVIKVGRPPDDGSELGIDEGIGQVDCLTLGNAESYWREVSDPAHIWWSNSRATVITVP